MPLDISKKTIKKLWICQKSTDISVSDMWEKRNKIV